MGLFVLDIRLSSIWPHNLLNFGLIYGYDNEYEYGRDGESLDEIQRLIPNLHSMWRNLDFFAWLLQYRNSIGFFTHEMTTCQL